MPAVETVVAKVRSLFWFVVRLWVPHGSLELDSMREPLRTDAGRPATHGAGRSSFKIIAGT